MSTARSFRATVLMVFLTTLFIFYSLFWAYTYLYKPSDSFETQLFTVTYGLIALCGGFGGLYISSKFGGIKSFLGRATVSFSLGLLFQEIGQLLYSYYIYILKIELPYPSVGDLFFYGTIPLYIYGAYMLFKIVVPFRSFITNWYYYVVSTVVPLGLLGLSYLLFLKDYTFDSSSLFTSILDFGVPLGQIVYISIALLTYFFSVKALGGALKRGIVLVILALLCQYVADFTFLWQANSGTWYPGNTNDATFMLAYFVMSVALLDINNAIRSIKSST